MLKEDDPINNDYVWKRVLIDKSNHTVDDLLMAKSKSDEKICELQEKISILNDQLIAKSKSDRELSNYKKEICELKENISILNNQLIAKSKSALSTNRKESVTHLLEIKNFIDFYVLDSGKINTLPFECLGLDFIINIEKSKDNYYFELALINQLDINKKVKATCELIIINNKRTKDKENKSLNLDLVFTQRQSFQSKELVTNGDFYVHNCGFKFIHNRVLKIQVNLTAELIELVD